MTTAALALLALAMLATCGGEGASDRTSADAVSTTVDTVGDVVRVVNEGTAPEWELLPVTSIGPTLILGGQAPNEFGRASSVALDPAGGAGYVANQLSCEIRAFGLDGVQLRTMGRCGEGPGEFSPFFYSIAWAGDRLLSLDLGAGRIGEISVGGEWLGQRRTVAARRARRVRIRSAAWEALRIASSSTGTSRAIGRPCLVVGTAGLLLAA